MLLPCYYHALPCYRQPGRPATRPQRPRHVFRCLMQGCPLSPTTQWALAKHSVHPGCRTAPPPRWVGWVARTASCRSRGSRRCMVLHRRAAAFAAAGTGAESRRCGDDEAPAPVRRGREGSMLDLRFGWSIASSSAMRYRSNGLCRPCDPPLLPRTPGLRVHAPFVTWPPCSPGGATAPLTVADGRSGGAGCSPEEKAALAICGDRWGRLVTSACSPPYTVCVTLLWVVRHPASTQERGRKRVRESCRTCAQLPKGISNQNLQLELQCLSLRQSRRLDLLLAPRLVKRALGQHQGGLKVLVVRDLCCCFSVTLKRPTTTKARQQQKPVLIW
jgi:hypothetical protein